MEQVLLPSTIDFIETDNTNIGKVIITPCHQGYGTTLGNALRRVLLSSLPGAAVESVKISGVQHEFSALEGVQEDVVEIIMNLKQLSVRCHTDNPVVLQLRKKGKGEILASDIDKNSDVEIMNPELKIATITDAKLDLEMEIVIGRGRGYVPVEEKDSKNLDLGTILIDSLYTPIRDVGYNVEMTRVGDVTDFEKLTLKIETNGTVTPKEAVQQATKILMDHFALILDVAGNGFGAVETTQNSAVVEEEVDDSVENEGDIDNEAEEESVKKTKKKAVKKSKKEE